MLFKVPGSFKKMLKIGGNVEKYMAYRLISFTPTSLPGHFTLALKWKRTLIFLHEIIFSAVIDQAYILIIDKCIEKGFHSGCCAQFPRTIGEIKYSIWFLKANREGYVVFVLSILGGDMFM